MIYVSVTSHNTDSTGYTRGESLTMFSRLKQRAKEAFGGSADATIDPVYEQLTEEFSNLDERFSQLLLAMENFLEGVHIMCDKTSNISEVHFVHSDCTPVMFFF